MTNLTIFGHYLIQFIKAESHKHLEVTEKLFAAGIPAKVCYAKTFERSQWSEYLATYHYIYNTTIPHSHRRERNRWVLARARYLLLLKNTIKHNITIMNNNYK